jgi:hypothetical protein
METVEEQLRELATNCIQESQGKPLTNLTWWSATIPWRNTVQHRLIHPRLYVIHRCWWWEIRHLAELSFAIHCITVPCGIDISTFDWCFQITFFSTLFLRKFIWWRSFGLCCTNAEREDTKHLLKHFSDFMAIQLLLEEQLFL